MTTRQLNQETAQLGEINEEAKARIRSMDTNTRVRLWMACRLLKNVFEAADTRQKQVKKRSLCVINEHF